MIARIIAWVTDWPWVMIGGLASIAVLLLMLWTVVAPLRRRRALSHPAKVHFNICSLSEGPMPYAVQDDQNHYVKELVLPSNSLCYVEVHVRPRVSFSYDSAVFGCDGEDINSKPLPKTRESRFTQTGKSRWVPGVDDSDTIDRKGWYHIKGTQMRSIGTSYVYGFMLETQKAGIYRTYLAFLGGEVEGNAELSIRVEDNPKTKMKCDLYSDYGVHWGCYVKPAGR